MNQFSIRLRKHQCSSIRIATSVSTIFFFAAAGSVAADLRGDTRSNASLEEVVVTAQKRSERLQDVPVPVSVLETEVLVDTNQLRLQDYATRVPGLSVVPQEGGIYQAVTIRGLTSGGVASNPSVAFLVDDVPFGTSTGLAGGGFVPDLDPGDIARVEVLRGPQGTLYGASSLGGLIKYVTVEPSLEERSGRLSLGTTTVKNGHELGYNVRGNVNIPLGDALAVGLSGYSRREPGFIDNDLLGIEGVNELRVRGGRFAGVWRPAEDWLLKLSAIIQDHESLGGNSVQVDLGEFQQNYPKGIQAFEKKFRAFSATLHGKVGGIDLTSISGYNTLESFQTSDVSGLAGFFGPPGSGITGALLNADFDIDRFTQEIRLAVTMGRNTDLLIGGYYTEETSHPRTDGYAMNPVSGAIISNGYDYHFKANYKYEEHAAFADLTVRLTDRLDVQLGGRKGRIEQSNSGTTIQSIFTGDGTYATTSDPRVNALTTPSTYLATPRFKLSPDLMIYARLASGYRVGGTNSSICTNFGFPCQYNPDKSKNYEIGMKGDFWGHALTTDVSVYYIDWEDIQLTAFTPDGAFSFAGNGGKAKSQGVDLSAEYRLPGGLSVAGWAAWNDAELTEDSTLGNRGDRLPFGAEWSGRLSLNQDFALTSRFSGFLEGAVNYVGERTSFIGSSGQSSQNYPSYTKFDASAGARSDSGWAMNLFVTNVTDKRATHTGNPVLGTVIYIQPRTFGMNLTREF